MKKRCILGLLLAASAPASTILSGSFTQDDQVQWFTLSLASAGPLTVISTGYQSGGFDPILSLFSGGSTGPLLAVQTDSIPLSLSLPSGVYALALTQYDNFPVGPMGADGFLRDGQGNFTPTLSGFPGVKFLDQRGSQRTGDWILTFDGANVQVVPEPGTFFTVALFGAFLLYPRYRHLPTPAAPERRCPHRRST